MESSIGNLATLSKQLEENRPRLLAILRRRIDPALNVRLDPEDILSEAYLIASRRYAKFDQQTQTAFSWLYQIAMDCLIEAWRRETRGRRDLARDLPWPEESSAQLGTALAGQGTSPSEAVERLQCQHRIQHVLKLMKPEDREILWMRHYDQMSYREAGEVFGISESAATLRYVRAMKRLKSLWKRLFGTDELA